LRFSGAQFVGVGGGGMNSGRILIVEDEPALMRGLKDAFEDAGFQVLCAADGQKGLELAVDARPDLILLDIMLPKVNGYEICRAVRSEELDMPIIMLTAKGQEEDIILGLNLGADDYVTKPFKLGELMARAKAFLRRRRGKPLQIVRFGEFELNLTAHVLLRQGREVELTAKEFALLAFFACRIGRALARDTILSAVWGGSVAVTPRSVDRCVTTLRAKIEENPQEPVFVQTIRDVGYRFEIDPSKNG
jgi:DNA-binding response OmpR family regulator